MVQQVRQDNGGGGSHSHGGEAGGEEGGQTPQEDMHTRRGWLASVPYSLCWLQRTPVRALLVLPTL